MYSVVGIVNLALSRIGSNPITALTDNSPNAIAANAVWEYVRDEVLQAKDWRFAKTRVSLELRYETPDYAYTFAYVMPTDFLRLCKQKQPSSGGMNPVALAPGYLYQFIDSTGYGRYYNYDPPVYPPGYPYVVENVPVPTGLEKIANGAFTGASTGWTLGSGWTYAANQISKVAGNVNTLSQLYSAMTSVPVIGEMYVFQFEIIAIDGGSIIPTVAGVVGTPISTFGVKQQTIIAESAVDGITFTPSSTDLTCTIDNVSLVKITDALCLLTDYDNTDFDLHINYIKKVLDPTKYTSAFINALAMRLAAELSIKLTENIKKFEAMFQLYQIALTSAAAQTESLDYIQDEEGSNDWEMAGR